jgi:hypothetical protein
VSVLCFNLCEAITLRPATPQDRAACEEISQQVYETVYRPLNLYTDNQAYTDEVSEWAFDLFYDQKIGHFLVAENEEKRIVGFMYVKRGIFIDETGDIVQQIRNVLALTEDEREALCVDEEI